MPYDINLANRIREFLSEKEEFRVEEKEMFGGLAFLVNDKMCINVASDQLMCRYDPDLTEQLSERPGFVSMVMKGREFKGYCYVDPVGYTKKSDFEFWLNLCLDFNDRAAKSKSKRKKLSGKA